MPHPLKTVLQYSGLAVLAAILCGNGAWAETCPLPGQKPMLVAELFFGAGAVPEPAWRRFLAREVTARFPDGFTALDAHGQWRDPLSGQVAAERSKVLIIAAEPSPETLSRVEDLAASYRKLFRQRSVGIVTTTACAAF
jgi:hypothetical protein